MAAHDDKRAEALQARQRQLASVRKLRIERAINDLSSTPEGREFLWWLLEVGKVGVQPFTTNALTTAFQCGELNVGNTILERLISVNPAIYVRMQQEHQNEYDSLVSANADLERAGRDPESAASEHPGGYDLPELD